MVDPEQSLEQISQNLLGYLGAAWNNPKLGYQSPLTPLQGGYETSTYRFSLSGAGQAQAAPLVLRLYPRSYGAGNAVWESTIQNVLAEAGYPVSRVHLVCTDLSVLGGAFLVMALLEGEPMMNAPMETIPGLLGRTHAALHDLDPEPLRAALRERGLDERRYRFDGRLQGLRERAAAYPRLHDAVEWLVENRPPEPARLSICHGDFHPLNLLVQEGRVTGVLDWGGFMVADPCADVATTVVLTTISAKHLLSVAEWKPAADMYLEAYRARRALDLQQLDYYRARRCVIALVDGASGQAVWQHPGIVQDLIASLRQITGIRVQT